MSDSVTLSPEDAAWALLTAMDGPDAEDRFAGECRRRGLGAGPNPPEVALVAVISGLHLLGHGKRIRECLPAVAREALEFGALEAVTERLMRHALAAAPGWKELPDPARYVYLLAKWARAEAVSRALESGGIATDDGTGDSDVMLYCAKRLAADTLAEMQGIAYA